ncbi:MAG: DNA/RNA non-specific endonuclease [Clostridiales bacterium]|nr:DNA/RNA non-specific endonuclease [Clostridiales bacterium]
MKNKFSKIIGIILLTLCLVFAGCGSGASSTDSDDTAGRAVAASESDASAAGTDEPEEAEDVSEEETESGDEEIDDSLEAVEEEAEDLDSAGFPDTGVDEDEETVEPDDIPDYDSSPYVVVNDNIPFFTEDDLTTEPFETYSKLDSLGRCGVAYANICQEIMPTEKRGDIGSVKPTGWHTVKYDCVDGKYLYNRCHLIAYELAGENANNKNLITGTRYFNVQGMLPFENLVADYVKESNHHVLYRVTPIFDGDNLVADGVLMEAESVEDEGRDVEFCVFCYNVEPGIDIDYATGDSREDDSGEAGETSTASSGKISTGAYSSSSSGSGKSSSGNTGSSSSASNSNSSSVSGSDSDSEEQTYILNTNTKKFHYPDCSSVSQMSDKNKKEYTGTREELISEGYSPCGSCNP